MMQLLQSLKVKVEGVEAFDDPIGHSSAFKTAAQKSSHIRAARLREGLQIVVPGCRKLQEPTVHSGTRVNSVSKGAKLASERGDDDIASIETY